MLTLIKNADVFSPRALGRQDVLIAGEKVVRVDNSIRLDGTDVSVVDARDCWLIPGLVDALTHPCGGGGEGGFANRTGEISAQAFIRGGVTSPIGALGTDSITRNLETLFGHTMALRAAGLAAFMYTGSYRVPLTTLTGDAARDMILTEPVLGAGEVAIADHRSSHPDVQELRRLASDIALGGTLSGKGGTLLIHVGDSPEGLQLIEDTLARSSLPRRLFYPTHVNRHAGLLEQAVAHTREGGYADFTVSTTPELIESGEIPALEALQRAIEDGAPAGRLTVSSDAGGSLPHYVDGRLVGLRSAPPDSLIRALQSVISRTGEVPQAVLAAMTLNPANALCLSAKGRVAPGADADLLLLEAGSGTLKDVFCRGRRLLQDSDITHTHQDQEQGAHS